MTLPLLAQSTGSFGWLDWSIVAAYLIVTTLIGGALAGKQATIRDFFLGGRKLPWYAVSGSIIATELSALTFVSVPFVVFQPGGNLTYLQLALFGSLIARIIVGCVLVPAYYQREVYSPYDYMGNRFGPAMRSTATAMFAISGMLAQSARVYLTAVVLRVILHRELGALAEVTGIPELAWAVMAIGVFAILWTLIGGITTVIWTDVILFLVFLVGAIAALIVVCMNLAGGFGEIVRVGTDAGKFQFFDFSTEPWAVYTIWTAVIASTWGGLGAYGTDQLLAQRMLCCKGVRQARWAIISSTLGQSVALIVMLVGIGLYAYYREHPLTGEWLRLYREKGDSIFPIFIVNVIPTGLKGLIIGGIFAAAISSLDSIMAALSQTVMSAFYLPRRRAHLDRLRNQGVVIDEQTEERRNVRVSRLLVLFWGVVLCGLAVLAQKAAEHYRSILDLGLAMAGYAGGGIFSGFLLAFLPLRIDGRGYLFAAPLSVFTVFALAWHAPWAHWVCWTAAVILILFWFCALIGGRVGGRSLTVRILQTGLLLIGIAAMILASHYGYWQTVEPDGTVVDRTIAWPWYAPAGSLVAFFWGWGLSGRPRSQPADAT